MAPTVKINRDGDLEVGFSNGQTTAFSAIWLRYNDRSLKSRHGTTGQRIFHINELPDDLCLKDASVSGDNVSVEFGGTDYELSTSYSLKWLQSMASQKSNQTANDVLGCSTKSTLPEKPILLPPHDYEKVLGDEAARFRMLSDFVDHGYFILKNVPVKNNASAVMARKLWNGPISETNYGGVWDVMVDPSVRNLAYTNVPITIHTDNNYRDPSPELQILHCMINKCQVGGETGVCDGYAVANRLREENTEGFELLTKIFVSHEYESKGPEGTKTLLRKRMPVIRVDDRGQIIQVAFNNRSACSIDPSHGAEATKKFYRAYERFRLIGEEFCAYTKLLPGDALVFDNIRMLHARTGFSVDESVTGGGPVRQLQGIYSSRDALFDAYLSYKRNNGIEIPQL